MKIQWIIPNVTSNIPNLLPVFWNCFHSLLPSVSTKICSRFCRGWTQPDSAQELPRGVEPLHCHGGAAAIFLRMRPRFWVMHGLWIYNMCMYVYIYMLYYIKWYHILFYDTKFVYIIFCLLQSAAHIYIYIHVILYNIHHCSRIIFTYSYSIYI